MEHHDRTQAHRGEQDVPNRASEMEQAEGSRETVNSGSAAKQEGGELTEEAVGQPDEQGGGISNRPLEEEQDRQGNLPPRGERRADRQED